jgi:dihydrolipoamide dehydrogenase
MAQPEIVVLGGGPAGVTAALRARELGAAVTLIERGQLGGTCTNDGCAPTRALAKTARLLRDAEQFEAYGLRGERPTLDFAAVMTNVRQIIGKLHDKKQIVERLQRAGVTVAHGVGNARFHDAHTLVTENGAHFAAERFILCAGGRARRLAFPGSEHVYTHSDVWRLTALPPRLAVVGSAATGCQLASIFDAFGSMVTLLELAPRILPLEEPDVSAAMQQALTRRGMTIHTGIGGIQAVERGAESLVVRFGSADAPQQIAVDAVIAAVGWPGNADQLGLDVAGVQHERGYIVVDDTLRTSAPHIFAAGDLTGRMMLVQSATYEGRLAAQNAVLGRKRAERHTIVPRGGFTDPEYAGVGLSAAQAAERYDSVVATVPYASLDRAVIDGRSEGFCKLIASRETHEILGAHVVGEQAVEIVQIVAAVMATGGSVERLATLQLAYPTFAAVVGLAARDLARQLGTVQVAADWGALPEVAEWEAARG